MRLRLCAATRLPFTAGLIVCLASAASAQGLSGAAPVPATLAERPRIAAILNANPAWIVVVDARTGVLRASLPSHPSPVATAQNLELSPDGKTAWVLHTNGDLTRVELQPGGQAPVVVSPPPTSIPPFYAITMKDLEISPDGTWLVVTAFDTPGWYVSSNTPRVRLSIYPTAAPAASRHVFTDLVPTQWEIPALHAAIAPDDVCWLADGDYGKVLAVDLFTGLVAAALDSNEGVGVPIGGSGPGLKQPVHDIQLRAGVPVWLPIFKPPFVRFPDPSTGALVDVPVTGLQVADLFADDESDFVVATRRFKTVVVGQPVNDQFALMNLATGDACRTPELGGGAHRFSSVAFLPGLAAGRVFALDDFGNQLVSADFSPFLAAPASGGCAFDALLSFDATAIDLTIDCDGRLLPEGRYILHDGQGGVGAVNLNGGATLDFAVAPFAGTTADPATVDIEVSGAPNFHRDV